MRPRGLRRNNQEGVAWQMRNRTDAPQLWRSSRMVPSLGRLSRRRWEGVGRRVMLLAPALALLAASAAHAANGRLAFEVPSPHASSVKTVNPDGSQLAAMPGLPKDSGQATWSANGMLLAFSSPLSGRSQIWAINAAGKARERLTHGNVPAIDPAWSPRDRAIVFCRVHRGVANIYVLSLFPRRLTRLTRRAEIDLQPRWSPDGKTIAFASNRTGTFQIFTMQADGSHQHRLTTQPGSNSQPTWAPGSQQLAYTNTVNTVSNIDAISLAGGAPRQITTAGGADPAWSPDGQQIAFTRSGGVWSVPASGEAADAAATRLAAVGTGPSWAPLLNPVGAVSNGTATVKLQSGKTIVLGQPALTATQPSSTTTTGTTTTSTTTTSTTTTSTQSGVPLPTSSVPTGPRPSVEPATAGGALTPPRPMPATSGSSGPTTTTTTSTSPSIATTSTSTTSTTSTGLTGSSGSGSSGAGRGTTSGASGSTTAATQPAAQLPPDSTVIATNTSVTVAFKPQTEPLTAPPSTAVVSHGTFTIASRTDNLLSLRLDPPASCRAARVASPERVGMTVHITHGHTGVRNRQIFADSLGTTWTVVYSCRGTQVKVTEGLVVVTLLQGRHRQMIVPAGHSLFIPA